MNEPYQLATDGKLAVNLTLRRQRKNYASHLISHPTTRQPEAHTPRSLTKKQAHVVISIACLCAVSTPPTDEGMPRWQCQGGRAGHRRLTTGRTTTTAIRIQSTYPPRTTVLESDGRASFLSAAIFFLHLQRKRRKKAKSASGDDPSPRDNSPPLEGNSGLGAGRLHHRPLPTNADLHRPPALLPTKYPPPALCHVRKIEREVAVWNDLPPPPRETSVVSRCLPVRSYDGILGRCGHVVIFICWGGERPPYPPLFFPLCYELSKERTRRSREK